MTISAWKGRTLRGRFGYPGSAGRTYSQKETIPDGRIPPLFVAQNQGDFLVEVIFRSVIVSRASAFAGAAIVPAGLRLAGSIGTAGIGHGAVLDGVQNQKLHFSFSFLLE